MAFAAVLIEAFTGITIEAFISTFFDVAGAIARAVA